MERLVYSADAWRLLNGLVSVYKPAGITSKMIANVLRFSIVEDLNCMERKVDPRFILGQKNLGEIDPSRRVGPMLPQKDLIENQLKVPPKPAKYIRPGSQEMIDQTFVDLPDTSTDLTHTDEDQGKDLYDEHDSNFDDSYFAEEKELVDYSSHPLVLGPAYEGEDVNVFPVNFLTTRASGVMLLGVNKGLRQSYFMRKSKPLHTYEVSGEFGRHTKTGFSDGPTISKATWKHLTRRKFQIDQACANIEASHRKQAWELVDVDPQSQEAYDLAAKGPLRPKFLTDPLIYSIRCTHWDLPKFKVKIQCVGDDHRFILDLISELGIRLRTYAHTTSLRCSQVAVWTAADHCLLPQQFSLQNVIQNLQHNSIILRNNRQLLLYRQSNFNFDDKIIRTPML